MWLSYLLNIFLISLLLLCGKTQPNPPTAQYCLPKCTANQIGATLILFINIKCSAVFLSYFLRSQFPLPLSELIIKQVIFSPHVSSASSNVTILSSWPFPPILLRKQQILLSVSWSLYPHLLCFPPHYDELLPVLSKAYHLTVHWIPYSLLLKDFAPMIILFFLLEEIKFIM